MNIYIVAPGDTLTAVARRFGTNPTRLITDNGLERPGNLVVGQALIITEPDQVYTVRQGDTLYSIAASYGTNVNQLLRNNPELTSEELYEGQTIIISYTDKPQSTVRINGYVYPFISLQLLRRELPFLSTLTIFGYGFTESGELIEPNDVPLIEEAERFGVASVLLLSSVTESGSFSTERASLLFNDIALRTRVLSNLVSVMNEKGYRGLDIDFEYVSPDDAQAFLDFISQAVDIMHVNGFFVNVDLAPKASADQRGLLYEAHNYPAIGSLADTVLLMTYEWGYTYGLPMAVAPLDQVTRIVDYAVSVIPIEKIMLGIPNYGYDWALPFRKGETRAVSIGNQEAITIASQYNAEIGFDETAASPFFFYRNINTAHEVWFEDVRSIYAKFGLVDSESLRGFGYWNLMRPFAQNYTLLALTYIPERV